MHPQIHKLIMELSQISIEVIILVALSYLILQRILKLKSDIKPSEILNETLPAIREMILYEIANAEIDWKDYIKSGVIKKSQVISRIYEKFPVLQSIVNQEVVVKEIEYLIEKELDDLKHVFEFRSDPKIKEVNEFIEDVLAKNMDDDMK